MKHIFISYFTKDSDRVDRLVEKLEENNFMVWLDKTSINPGEKWETSIRNGIEKGGYFIACFSNSYYNDETSYFHKELKIAINQLLIRRDDTNWFVPVLFEEMDLPDIEIGGLETLKSIQYIDLYKGWNDGVDKLLTVLSGSDYLSNIEKEDNKEYGYVTIKRKRNFSGSGCTIYADVPYAENEYRDLDDYSLENGEVKKFKCPTGKASISVFFDNYINSSDYARGDAFVSRPGERVEHQVSNTININIDKENEYKFECKLSMFGLSLKQI